MVYYRRRFPTYKKKIKPKKIIQTDLEKLGYGDMWEGLLKKSDLTCPKCSFKNNSSYIDSKDISTHTQYKYQAIKLEIDKYGLYGVCTKCNKKFTFKVNIDVSKDHVVSACEDRIVFFNKNISFLKKNYKEMVSIEKRSREKYNEDIEPYNVEERKEKAILEEKFEKLQGAIDQLIPVIAKLFVPKYDKSIMWKFGNFLDPGEGNERLVGAQDIKERYGYGDHFYIKFGNISEFQRLANLRQEREAQRGEIPKAVNLVIKKYSEKKQDITFKYTQTSTKFNQQTRILQDKDQRTLLDPNIPSDLEKLENLKLKPSIKKKELRLRFLKRVFRLTNGSVYVLGNDLMPDLYKVGWTERSPEERARGLSGTGQPAPFKVIFSVITDLDMKIEKEIHKRLDKYRYRQDREFFKTDIETIKNAIKETMDSKIS